MTLSDEQRERDIVGAVPVPSRFLMPGAAKKLDSREMIDRYQAAIAACDVHSDQPLVAITSYYNPCGYWSRFYNYWEFALGLARHGIKLFTAEVVHSDQPVIPNSVPFQTDHVMWHKERALNLLAGMLVDSCRYVAWVDCDLVWSTNWYHRAMELLKKKPIVQLFEKIVFLDAKCERSDELPRYGFARAFQETRPWYPSSNHPPGGAWAANRIMFEKFGGLYDRLVSGGADCFCTGAFIDAGMHNPVLAKSNGKIAADYAKYARDLGAYARGDIGYTKDIVYHLYHGDRANKQYEQRMSYMLDFDPDKSIEVGKSGLYEWRGRDRSDNFRKYFSDRREDA